MQAEDARNPLEESQRGSIRMTPEGSCQQSRMLVDA